MNVCDARELLQATAQGLLTMQPGDSHRAIAGLIRLVERVAESDPDLDAVADDADADAADAAAASADWSRRLSIGPRLPIAR